MADTLTARELIEELSTLSEADLDKEVRFCYNYGDHWHTLVAPGVRIVEPACVKHSRYHDMDKVVDDEDMKEQESVEGVRRVILIGSYVR